LGKEQDLVKQDVLLKTQGIRILDNKNGVVSVKLPDILDEKLNGDSLYWSILFLEASGHLGENKSILEFCKQINKSQNGLILQWSELKSLAYKFFQVIDIIILGCKDSNLLHRYDDDQEMYESCDIFIEMFDSWFWQVFSKDKQLIDRLASKFKDIKFLESDFEK
jgi:hypothetical protein